jgi:hypothetical protein
MFPRALMDFGPNGNGPSADVSAPAVAPVSIRRCANCGESAEATQPCAAHHDTCADCQFACHNCGIVLCLSCTSRQCQVCGKLHCADCVVACERRGSWVCVAHIAEAGDVCASRVPHHRSGEAV